MIWEAKILTNPSLWSMNFQNEFFVYETIEEITETTEEFFTLMHNAVVELHKKFCSSQNSFVYAATCLMVEV